MHLNVAFENNTLLHVAGTIYTSISLIKEALNGLIQENEADSKKTKMGSNNNQGLVHVIKAVGEVN
jgi:hypothetical protein